jgi:2-polyprenyl-6-methoxyphenol hydroxylase-like FAD-dependent oxidoreductase
VAGLTAAIAFAAGRVSHRLRRSRPADHRTGHEGGGPAHHGLSAAVAGVSRPDRHLGAACAPRHAASGHAHRGCRRRGAEPRVAHDFNAADISDKPFGWNLPNWLLRREMVAHLADGMADFRPGIGTAQLLTRETEARVTLSDGARLRARLVIAADGRNSAVREAAGIDVRTTRYGQKALAFAVTHPIPHENVSTEIHRSGGPFTLVPLPDYTGEDGIARPSSAIVWMERGPEVRRLMALDTPEFEAEMTERSAHLFGPLTLVSRRTVWPIISQTAGRSAPNGSRWWPRPPMSCRPSARRA